MIIHIDCDAFYCGVEEKLDPTLKGKPFIVAQKNCVSTLSYVARDLGLRKLMKVTDVISKHPDMLVVNGESLAKYRREGKNIVRHVRRLLGCPIERLGVEEMWIDISELVQYNIQRFHETGVLHSLEDGDDENGDGDGAVEGVNLHFRIGEDPQFIENFMDGIAGSIVPDSEDTELSAFVGSQDKMEAYVAAYIAQELQRSIDEDCGISCSIGVGVNKTLAKMVGSVHKPHGLTTLLPGFAEKYLDPLPISKIPYCGYKTVAEIKERLGVAEIPTIEQVKVSFSKQDLELIRPGLWGELHGHSESVVKDTPLVGTQITIEDSYWKGQTATMDGVEKCITQLTTSLVNQVVEDAIDPQLGDWIARPTAMRIAVRLPKMDNIKRRAKQMPVPQFFFKLAKLGLDEDCTERDELTTRFVGEFMKMFRQVTANRPTNVELINVGVTGLKPNESKLFRDYFAHD